MSTEDMEKRGFDTTGFVFHGTPEEKMDVEQEVNDTATNSEFDAYKLAEVLVKIMQRMVGVTLYDYQKEPAFRIVYSLLVGDGAEITILYPRQSGKSEVVSMTVTCIGVLFPVLAKIFPKQLGHFKSGVKMGLLAPQLDQVYTVYERCMERLLSPPVKVFLDDPDIADQPLSTVNFKLKSGSFLKGQSAAKQSKVESKTYHIVYLDESQDLDTDKVRRSIIPMTASTFGTIVRTGTPSRYKGDFYHTINNNKKHDKGLRSPKERAMKQKHFQYDYKTVIKHKMSQFKLDGLKFHTLYEKAVMRDRDSMGENSDAFRMAYKIEWLLDVGMFATEETMEEYVYDKRISFPTVGKSDFVVAGLDIASARASTVLTVGVVDAPAEDFGERPRKTVVDWLELTNTNYEEQFHIIMQTLEEMNVRVLFSDYTGVGRALTDMFTYHLEGIVEVVPYTFTPSSKSDMWKRLDEDIQNRRIVVPAHKSVRDLQEFKNFEEQMVNLTKIWKGPLMVCEKGGGYKDDYCDSFALMNLAGNHVYTPPTEIEITSNNKLIGSSARRSMISRSRY